jgi:stress response protein SCP2
LVRAFARAGRFDLVTVLSQGQEWTVADGDGLALTRVRMGIGWDKDPTAGAIASGRADIDLDATAMQFAEGQLFDIAFYNNLATRDGSVVHQGDNQTGSGGGDDETIHIDLGRVYGKVDTIVFLVSSYQGHDLTWVNNAYCRLLDDQDVELARYTLTGGSSQTGMVMAKLVRESGGWKLVTVGEGVAVTVPTEAVAKIARFA